MALKAVDTPERLTRSGRVRKHRSRHLRPKSPKSALTHNSLIPPTPGLDGATSLTARRPLTRSLTGQRPPDSGVPTASLALSAADGIGNGSAFTTGGYLITPAPSDDPFRRLSPRGFRYQLRSNPTMPNPENATPPLTLDVESMDDEIAAPPTEEERLMAELKEKNKTIRTLKRKLAAINKVNAKHESAKLHRQRILENQKRKLKQSEKAQRIAETKATELEKSHRKLRFEKYVDEEVRKQLAEQSKEFQEIWEVAEQKMFEKRFEELKKAVGCDVIVTRVHPAASKYQRTEDLRGIHSSMMAQLKQVHSVSGKCNPTKIEYILNDELYHRYKETKAKLEAAGHPVDEMLIFHGTREDNIDAIVATGFRIGGIDDWGIAHGASLGHGVYGCPQPEGTLFYQYSQPGINPPPRVGMRRIIGFRAFPGKPTQIHMFGKPKEIGEEQFDSHSWGNTYVIRRSCQTLPCFIIYY